MFTGRPITVVAKSVPWSRLYPRRKYWLAFPSPLCCVTIRPGTASNISPGRVTGRALSSCPVKAVWLAMLGGVLGPDATLGAPVPPSSAATGCGVAAAGEGGFGDLADVRVAGVRTAA